MFRKTFWFVLLFSCLAAGVACGSLFKKKEKSTDDDVLSNRFPADWDLISDWTGNEWKVKDL